jgi:OmpA-OmpF porin, OOP family
VPAPSTVTVTVREPNEVLLLAQVVFRFDKAAQADVAAGSLVAVQALLQKLRDDKLVLQSIQLTGHADRLNATGLPDYNMALSDRRVRTVREYLLAQGVPADKIRVEAQGDRLPRASCDKLNGAALQDCLLPDRRVELTAVTRRP